MLSFAQSHTYTCMCLCVWFSSRPCYCGETSTIQTFFRKCKGPRFVFPPLLRHFATCVHPCHLPPLCGEKNHSDISNIYKDGLPPQSNSLLIQWQDLNEESSCITSRCAPQLCTRNSLCLNRSSHFFHNQPAHKTVRKRDMFWFQNTVWT